MLTRLAAAAAALLLLPTLAACGGGSSSTTAQDPASTTPSATPSATGGPVKAGPCAYPVDPAGAAKKVNPPSPKPTVKGQVKTTISTSVGTFHAVLDAKKTPCTVNSFVSLAQQGYFDNTPCHRLTTAATGIFVLQCGDPTGTGRGGPGYTIPDELSGHETYPAGTLAMANTGAPDSGGSQFFMVYKNTPLPASYTVFGRFDKATIKLLAGVAKKGTDNAFGQGDGHPKQTVTITKVTTG